jgi:predicted phage tail component-like protein
MSLTLGGKRPGDFPGLKILIDTQEPAMPETRNRTLEIAGRHGVYDFGSDLGPRPFELKCALVQKNGYYLQDTVRALSAHLMESNGRPKIMDMIFDSEPDKVYRVRFAGSIPIQRLAGLGQFIIPMVAYDPFAYLITESDEIDVDSDVLVESDMTVDSLYTYDITSNPMTLEIDNFGTQDAAPVIEIIGSFSTLSIEAEGKTLNYTAPIGSTTLIIDCENFTAKIGSTNVLGNVTGDFITLPPGVIPVHITGTFINCSITFKFKPKFI